MTIHAAFKDAGRHFKRAVRGAARDMPVQILLGMATVDAAVYASRWSRWVCADAASFSAMVAGGAVVGHFIGKVVSQTVRGREIDSLERSEPGAFKRRSLWPFDGTQRTIHGGAMAGFGVGAWVGVLLALGIMGQDMDRKLRSEGPSGPAQTAVAPEAAPSTMYPAAKTFQPLTMR